MSEMRMGVFLCACGERIAAHLDLEALAREAAALPGVVCVERLPFSCSPDGLAAIQAAVAQHRLDRVLVAGCTPRTLAPRLRQACEAAGVEGSLFELADIREGCAWVHPGEPAAAAAKAAAILHMSVARLAARHPQAPFTGEVVPAALVIGGGLAGMDAALTLARAGVPVTLVEREAELGGLLRQSHTLAPDGRCAAGFLATKVSSLQRQPGVRLLLQSRVTRVSGLSGHYTVTVAHPGCPEGEAIEAGAVIVATGAQPARPHGLWRHDGRRVVTQLEFEAELRRREQQGQRKRRGRPREREGAAAPQDVAMVLCAGQRDGRVPYCSGVCCAVALKQALEVRAADPAAHVTIVCRDLCLDEEGEAMAVRARRAGVEFVRYDPGRPPAVTGEGVEVHDGATGQTCRLACDQVVLAVPLLPQADAGALAQLLGLTQDEHGFFVQARYRLRPEVSAARGIYICGAAHGPCSWAEAQFQATAAAFSALGHLRAGRVQSQAPVATVDEALCTGCGACAATCPFGAVTLSPREGLLSVSQIDPLRCKGCGSCAVACPVKAITLPVESEAALLAQIEATLTGPLPDGAPRILALGCEWSSHAAAELAGAHHLAYPASVRLLRVGCSARFDPMHILWAFACGADGVFLGACPPGQCHYAGGNQQAQERMQLLAQFLAAGGVDTRRLRFDWVTPDDAEEFVAKITAFAELVAALGPGTAQAARPMAETLPLAAS